MSGLKLRIARFAACLLAIVPVLSACNTGASPSPTAIATDTVSVQATEPPSTPTQMLPTATVPPADTPTTEPTPAATQEATVTTQASQPTPTPPTGAGPGDYVWSQVGLAGENIQSLSLLAGGTNLLLAAGPHGAWKGTYDYKAWQPLQVTLGGGKQSAAIAGPDTMYLTSNTGCASGGPITAYRTINGGQSWLPITNPPVPLRIVAADALTAYGTTCTSIIKTTDAGATWTEMPHSKVENFDPAALAIGPDGQSLYAAYYSEGGTTRVFMTDEKQTTWTEITPKGEELRAPVNFAVAKSSEGQPDQGAVYMTSSPGKLWSIAEASSTWTLIKAQDTKQEKPQIEYQISALFVDTAYSEDYNKPGPVLYAARTNMSSATNQGAGVFRSTDKGATWVKVGQGLDQEFVNNLVLAPHDPSVTPKNVETLIAATEHGIWAAPMPPPFR